jgi:hypothetical protein
METRTDLSPRIRLQDLPVIVHLAVGLSLFSAWVIFEEGVVDRTGLWELMPGYLRSRLCPWDLAALGVIFVPLLLLRGRGRHTARLAS